MTFCFRHLRFMKVHCARCAEVFCESCHKEHMTEVFQEGYVRPLHWALHLLYLTAIAAGFLGVILAGDMVVWVIWAIYTG